MIVELQCAFWCVPTFLEFSPNRKRLLHIQFLYYGLLYNHPPSHHDGLHLFGWKKKDPMYIGICIGLSSEWKWVGRSCHLLGGGLSRQEEEKWWWWHEIWCGERKKNEPEARDIWGNVYTSFKEELLTLIRNSQFLFSNTRVGPNPKFRC